MGKAKILVVEDDLLLRASIQDILELEQYEVMTAQNGQHALTVLNDAAEPPDLIVSDIMMPHMNGIEFLQEVRKEQRWVSIPFIFLTAKTEKADRHRGMLLGVDAYLAKPFDADDLLVAVTSRLQRSRDLKEVQVEEISDVKKNILTILNHEFRTPLTLVIAYAEMLKEFRQVEMSEEELLTFLKGVGSGADRLRRLIENFILLVELESGDAFKTYGWRKRPIEDIEPIFTNARKQIFIGEVEHECIVEIEENLPTIVADYEFLIMAVREMLDNAVKFSKPDKPIVLGAKLVDTDSLCIWVEDQGRGIPEAEFENIWKTFYQINRDQNEDQGAGSGLAIVSGVVDLHYGRKEVQSEVGKGSHFAIYIPLTPPDPPPSSK